MKEQTLDPGTRLALQSLIALSGTLMISSLLASWFLPRRGSREHDVGLTVFEVFAVFTSLTTAGLAFYFGVVVLLSGEPLGEGVFGAIAALVALSILLLALLSATPRFSSLPGGIGMHLPALSATLFAAFAAAVALIFLQPRSEDVVPAATLILMVGGVLALLFLRIERQSVKWDEKAMQQRVISLSSSGYRASEVTLLPGLPDPYSGATSLDLICWSKKGRLYLDNSACRHLRDEARRRWGDLEAGKAGAATGELKLMAVDLNYRLPSWPPRFRLTLSLYEEGKKDAEAHVLEADEMRLFDVTELGILRPR